MRVKGNFVSTTVLLYDNSSDCIQFSVAPKITAIRMRTIATEEHDYWSDVFQVTTKISTITLPPAQQTTISTAIVPGRLQANVSG